MQRADGPITQLAYQGHAPAPRRRSILADPAAEYGEQGYGEAGPAVVPQTLIVSPGPNGMETMDGAGNPIMSQPPAQPGLAAQNDELLHTVGNLQRELGDMRRLMEQQSFEREIQMAAFAPGLTPQGAGQSQHQGQGGQEYDPNAPVNQAQLVGALTYMQVMHALQAAEVTDEEQRVVLQQNPQLLHIQEPNKTTLLIKAVKVLRRQREQQAQSEKSRSQSTPSYQAQSQVLQQRPTGQVVPYAEAGMSQPFAGESQPGDAHAKAWSEYRRFEAMLPNAKTKRERDQILAQMKVQMKNAQRAIGLSDTALAKMGWTQGEGNSPI